MLIPRHDVIISYFTNKITIILLARVFPTLSVMDCKMSSQRKSVTFRYTLWLLPRCIAWTKRKKECGKFKVNDLNQGLCVCVIIRGGELKLLWCA
jgi:hypothetical protein